MKALLLGSGGREHALATALAGSQAVDDLVAAPGNPGIASVAETIAVDVSDAKAVTELARRLACGVVVIGPEAPLVAGVADALREAGTLVFGPNRAAAAVEGSKSFAKRIMAEAGVPTAGSWTFSDLDAAVEQLDHVGPPYVIKADGLAAGKGVVVTSDRDEAVAALRERLVDRIFGEAGTAVVIEEYLTGQELSVIAFSDGRAVVACEPAQDHKRAFDGDRGPNTGGMGSYSPVPACPPEVTREVTERVLQPMVDALARSGAPFVGALYAGLALTDDGPQVIEFNARFGDPETQALLPRLTSDLGELIVATASGDLRGASLSWRDEACVTVVLASDGYPGEYETGYPISGVDRASAAEGVHVFHAGTATSPDGSLVTGGGRVMAVSALGDGVADARRRAYEASEMISFRGKWMRSDIAHRAVQEVVR